MTERRNIAQRKDVNPAWFIFGWLLAAIGGYGLYLFRLRDMTRPRYEYYDSITELFQPNWFVGSGLVAGIGALFICIWVGKRFTPVVGVFFGLVTIGGVVAMMVVQLMGYDTQLKAEQAHADMLTALGEVCSSQNGNETAATYQDAPSTHPMLLYNMDTDGNAWPWDDDQPTEWIPNSVQAAELIGCVFRRTETVETCLYEDDVTLTRYRHWVEVWVYSAGDRRLLTQHRIDGEMPRPCQGFENFSVGASTESIYGGYPNDQQVIDLIRPIVEP